MHASPPFVNDPDAYQFRASPTYHNRARLITPSPSPMTGESANMPNMRSVLKRGPCLWYQGAAAPNSRPLEGRPDRTCPCSIRLFAAEIEHGSATAKISSIGKTETGGFLTDSAVKRTGFWRVRRIKRTTFCVAGTRKTPPPASIHPCGGWRCEGGGSSPASVQIAGQEFPECQSVDEACPGAGVALPGWRILHQEQAGDANAGMLQHQLIRF